MVGNPYVHIIQDSDFYTHGSASVNKKYFYILTGTILEISKGSSESAPPGDFLLP